MNTEFFCIYRTVLLRRNLKLLSFILLPVTQILIPVICMIVSLFTLFPWFACISFCGDPLKPWKEIENILGKTWKKFTSDIKEYADNYGHESGIPNNWDGKVYGLGVDPLVIAIAIFLYIFGVVSMSPVIFLIFIVKAVPIFVATFLECWKDGLALYIDTIKNYYSFEIFTNYWKALVEYFKLIKELNPSKLYECAKAYNKACNPTQCIPKKIGCSILCLWLPILLAYSSFIMGLVLVLTITPIIFLVCLSLWILFWPMVVIVPIAIYIGGKFD